MKKIIFICCTLLTFTPNLALSNDYIKLNSLKNLIYGTNKLDLYCYDASGHLGEKGKGYQKIRLNFKNKTIKNLLNHKYNFDISSSKNKINYFSQSIFNTFNTIDLKSLSLKTVGLNGVDYKNPDIIKLIEKNNVFGLMEKYENQKPTLLKCTNFWGKILYENSEIVFSEILKEASNFFDKKICKGIAKVGPDDPSINWNDCLGVKKISGDNTEVYIGKFSEGFFSGSGIIIYNSYPWTASYIVLGNFKEDELNGEALIFYEAQHLQKKIVKDQDGKSWKIKTNYVNGEIVNDPEYKEIKIR